MLMPAAHAEVGGGTVIFFLRSGWIWQRLSPQVEPVPVGKPQRKAAPRAGGRGKAVRKAGSKGRMAAAYCVRLCDGRYFPMAQPRRGVEECRNVWPHVEAAIYRSPSLDKGIDAARSASGSPYASLPNAYAYRRENRPECASAVKRHRDPLGDLAHDVTLRRGDVVVLRSEVAVFLGQRELPYSFSRFAPVSQFPDFPRSLRWTLQQLEIQVFPDAVLPGMTQAEGPPVRETRHGPGELTAATACGARQDGASAAETGKAGADIAPAALVPGEPVSEPASSVVPCR